MTEETHAPDENVRVALAMETHFQTHVLSAAIHAFQLTRPADEEQEGEVVLSALADARERAIERLWHSVEAYLNAKRLVCDLSEWTGWQRSTAERREQPGDCSDASARNQAE